MKGPAAINATHLEPADVRSPGAGLSQPLKVVLQMLPRSKGSTCCANTWNHVAGNWLQMFLLGCPLMQLFHGYRRHGGHVGHGPSSGQEPGKEG